MGNRNSSSVEIKKVFRSTSVPRDIYVNVETGETLSNSNIRVSNAEVITDVVELTYKGFLSVNSEYIPYLYDNLTAMEAKRFFLMGNMLRTSWNIVHARNNWPHSVSTLSVALGFRTMNSIYSFLDKLLSLNLIATRIVTSGRDGRRTRLIYVNPYVIKRRLGIHPELIKMFQTGSHNSMSGLGEDEYKGVLEPSALDLDWSVDSSD